jgi:hypothetical protein
LGLFFVVLAVIGEEVCHGGFVWLFKLLRVKLLIFSDNNFVIRYSFDEMLDG